MTAFDKLVAAYRDPFAGARTHQRDGGRVIAYVCDNVPIELIVAAGAFPLRLHPSPARSSGASKRLVDPLYTPDVSARPPFVSAILDLLLGEELGFVDAVIVPNNRASVQMLPRQLAEAALEHGISTPEIWFLDKAWSPLEDARNYNAGEIRDLHRRLSAWSGAEIDDAALSQAIALCNSAREAALAVQARRGNSTALAGSAALEMLGAAFALHLRDYAELVTEALKEEMPSVSGTSLYLGGSPVDTPSFYSMVEDLGANIVAEDHCWGARFADNLVAAERDPLDALAARFHDFPACSVRIPFERTIDANLARAQSSKANGAIFRVVAKDEVQMWETPEQVSAFREAGIPTLHLREQPYQDTIPDNAREAIRSFVAELAQ